MSSTTDTTPDSPLRAHEAGPAPTAAQAEAEERQRHREEARLIRTREAAARKDTASRDGQWAAGDKTPLNPNEEYKSTGDPLLVRERIDQHVLEVGLLVDSPAGPARQVPLVGPVYAASARHRWRQDRDPRAPPARRRVLHAAHSLRRRPAVRRAGARDRGHLHGVWPRHGGRQRSPEHPAALDPHRGRAGDLPARRGRWPAAHRGVRRHPARDPRLARGGRRQGRAHRPHTRNPRDHRPRHRLPRVLEPAPQVQDRRHRQLGSRTSSTRCRTSRCAPSNTPSSASATTCGWAAASASTPSSAFASAPS